VIDHLSLPVSDYARSRAFYDKALGALGYKVAMEVTDSPEFVGAGYGNPGGPEPAFWIGAPHEPGASPMTPEGQHVAFRAASRAAVDAFHREALAAGGTDKAPRACGRTTTPTTTPLSISTPTGTGSRRYAIGQAGVEWLAS
jgi:catechol 2,3-dioxygenase-like lactoylglutathione lyase family enzyme